MDLTRNEKSLGSFIVQTLPTPRDLLWTALPTNKPSHGTRPGLLLFFISLLWRNKRHFQEFVLSGLRREKSNLYILLFCPSQA